MGGKAGLSRNRERDICRTIWLGVMVSDQAESMMIEERKKTKIQYSRI